MQLDHLDAHGAVVRFPAERRQAPDLCLAAELSAIDEIRDGLLDHGPDTGWPDWRSEGAAGVAALAAAHEAGGMGPDAALARLREHVAGLVAAAVALGWAYRDARHAAERARAALDASAMRPGGDWLGRHATAAEHAGAALRAAAAASCAAYLLASGASQAVDNLALGRGARPSTKAELEADHLALWGWLQGAAGPAAIGGTRCGGPGRGSHAPRTAPAASSVTPCPAAGARSSTAGTPPSPTHRA